MRTRLNQMVRMAMLPVLAFGLTACSIFPAGKAAPLHRYLVTFDTRSAPPSPKTKEGSTGTLLVNVPRAQAGFDTPQMAYLLRPYAVEYYAYNQWADTPARLLAPLLVHTLEQTGRWHAVVQLPAAVQGDYRLDTEILQWQHEFFSPPSRVRLALRVQLVKLHDHLVVAAHLFERVEEAPSDDAYGGVTATNRALAPLLTQIAQWVNAHVNNGTEHSHSRWSHVPESSRPFCEQPVFRASECGLTSAADNTLRMDSIAARPSRESGYSAHPPT